MWGELEEGVSGGDDVIIFWLKYIWKVISVRFKKIICRFLF